MAAKNPDIIEFEHKGKRFEADGRALRDYGVIKGIARVEKDPAGYFDSLEAVFMGRDEEYMAELGGGASEMEGLYAAAAKAVASAKNS
ncbi:hypothetical protein [Paraeggerthella hongkongensis]|uniref:Uncharacterized protein n=1 Tax=Paraeggerthella hongkongensis TaxID=230658 RepID=A0A3N0BCB4_9ACTN|nr:hypothetical protein [Paraeggerthella hongkongensis]RNL44732.1 hypothetical protein DMP08_05955 [Paraeggerthella hongkongensis]